jgi:hypothetical protein
MFGRGKNSSVKFHNSNPLKRSAPPVVTNPITSQYPEENGDEEVGGVVDQIGMLREIGLQLSDTILKIIHSSTLGSSNREEEIHHLFLDKYKYGLPGTDGSRYSNYIEYINNHHPWIALLYADSRNPFSKRRRFTLVLSKLGLITFLCAFTSSSASDGYFFHAKSTGTLFVASLLTALCSLLWGTLVEYVARCPCHTAKGSFVDVNGQFERMFMVGASIFLGAMIVAAVVLITEKLSVDNFYFPAIFIFAVAFDFGAFFYLGFINWVVVSWEGILCCPMCPAWYDGDSGGCFDGLVMCPLLSNPLVEFFLNPFYLAERTYLEDRARFRDEYPGRVCIDDYKDDGGTKVASIQLSDVDPSLLTSERDPFVEIYTTTRGSSTYVKCRTNVELSEDMRLMLCDIIKARTSTKEHTTSIDMVVIGRDYNYSVDSSRAFDFQDDRSYSKDTSKYDRVVSLGTFFTSFSSKKEVSTPSTRIVQTQLESERESEIDFVTARNTMANRTAVSDQASSMTAATELTTMKSNKAGEQSPSSSSYSIPPHPAAQSESSEPSRGISPVTSQQLAPMPDGTPAPAQTPYIFDEEEESENRNRKQSTRNRYESEV